jgi:predicted Zn-dependent protease
MSWFEHRQTRADIGQAESDAIFYGQAIVHQRKGEYEKARVLLQNLIDREHHLAYELQLADLDLDAGRDNQAVDSLAGLYHSFPGNHAISLQYARALLKNREPGPAETASVVLRQQILRRPNDPQLHELYARAANVAGDRVRAKEAIAETYYLRGSIHEAAMQLQALTREEDLDYYQRARITARINEWRQELTRLGKEEG